MTFTAVNIGINNVIIDNNSNKNKFVVKIIFFIDDGINKFNKILNLHLQYTTLYLQYTTLHLQYTQLYIFTNVFNNYMIFKEMVNEY
jgi:hypothetical protein